MTRTLVSTAIVKSSFLFVVLLIYAVGIFSPSCPIVAAETGTIAIEWPNWRGPDQNGTSREKNLVSEIDVVKKKNLLWSSTAAAGISTPVVYNGKLYTISRHDRNTKREKEKVVCLDSATGEVIWQRMHNVYLSDVPAERVGWSNCVVDPETNAVYAQGVNGYFECLDATTGEIRWSKSLHEEFGALSTYGGRTNTPVVFDDLVIVSAVLINWGDLAKPAHRFLGMDKKTGEVRWLNGTKEAPEDTTYSTPVIKMVDGQHQMIFGSSDGTVTAMQPRTGKILWNFKLSRRGINVTPVVIGDMVYIGQGEENLDNSTMGCVVAINAKGASGDITEKPGHLVWMQKSAVCGKSSPLVIEDRMYIVDDSSNLFILNVKDGKLNTPRPIKLVGALTRGSPLYADGKIYMATTSGLHVMQPTPEGVKFLVKARLPQHDEVTGSIIASSGRIYLPSAAALYCFGTKDSKPMMVNAADAPYSTKPMPQDPQKGEPTWAQVVPCEALVQPGQTQQLHVRLFDAKGRFVKNSTATFTLNGKGKIDKDGLFSADTAAVPSATTIAAKVGELSGTARIRCIPPLPWKFTFDDIPLVETVHPVTKAKAIEGEPPVTWIGIRYRHKIRELDGEKVMVKVTTIPRGTRSQGWIGPFDMHDYTIQADLRGQTVLAKSQTDQGETTVVKLPDMGLINQRYTLDMMGEHQKLQLRSWTSQIHTHFAVDVPFEWKGDVWYTMKFTASNQEGNKVRLRGKVWERGKPEPNTWLVDAVDESPNVIGAPGLFGNASVAEVYIDNVFVNSNAD